MVKNLLQAMMPINLICSLSGFFYISENCVLSKKQIRFGIIEFLEMIRRCFYIYLILYIAVIEYWPILSWTSAIGAAGNLSIIAEFLEVMLYRKYKIYD